MIARGFALDHGGFAGRGEPAKQHCGFHLRRWNRSLVFDRNRIAGAAQAYRQSSAVGLFENLRAHAHHGFKHAPHGAAAQARVAIEDGFDRMTRGHPHGKPDAGAGVAEIDDAGGLEQRPDADAGNMPRAGILALDGGAELLAGARGRKHILALQEPLDRGLADGEQADQ